MKRLLLAMTLLFTTPAYAAFEPIIRGGRAAAMGGASVAEASNGWAAFSNPGGLATVRVQSVSVGYVPGLFGISEIATLAGTFVQPLDIGSFALSGSRFGFELYREMEFRAAFGTSLTGDVHLGLSMSYYSLVIERYGSDWTLGMDVGILVTLSDRVRLGVSASNVNAPTIGQDKERLPQVFVAGISYRPLHEVGIAADLVKDIRHETELQLGVEYTVLDIVDLRGGTSNNPAMLHGGVGVRYGFLGFDYTYRTHADLGASHMLSLTLRIGEI